ncbi:MAG: hypothetical protein JXQ71_00765 [Verrucomicrobia bacterium]|nr:hypothetical protein [Verrucomicrobiota bacterium]
MLKLLLHRRGRAAARVAGVTVALGVLLGLGIASCSPQVHALICTEAGHPDDYCPVKQFQSGLIEAPMVLAVVQSCRLVEQVTPCRRQELRLVPLLFRLSLSRAPPL